MACRDKLWLSAPFWKTSNVFRPRLLQCRPETSESVGIRRQIMIIRSLLPTRDKRVRWQAETNYGHPPLFLTRDKRVRWHAETNYGHPLPFANQRQVSPLAHEDKLWSSAPFCQPETSESVGTRRQIMVIHHPCHPKTSKSVGTRRLSWSSFFIIFKTIEVFLCYLETIESDSTQRQILSSAPFVKDSM